MKDRKIAKALEDFAQAALVHQECLANGQWRKGNRAADRLAAAIDVLFSFGAEGREQFATLLEDERLVVRYQAAGVLVAFAEERSLAVLREVARIHVPETFWRIMKGGAEARFKRWEEWVASDRKAPWGLDPTYVRPEHRGEGEAT